MRIHNNLPYKTRLILPHTTDEWQMATEIAREIPELSAQQVAAHLAWRMVNVYVECKVFHKRNYHSGRNTIKKFRLKKTVKPTAREEAIRERDNHE